MFGEHPSEEIAHAAVHVFGSCAAILFFAGPLILPYSIYRAATEPFARMGSPTKREQIVCVGAYLVILAGVVYVGMLDPIGASEWFWD